MKCENFPDGITTCSRACCHIYFSGIKRLDWGKKAPALTLSQLRILLRIVLPMRVLDIDLTIELVGWIQARNHRAYLSHRRKKVVANNLG